MTPASVGAKIEAHGPIDDHRLGGLACRLTRLTPDQFVAIEAPVDAYLE